MRRPLSSRVMRPWMLSSMVGLVAGGLGGCPAIFQREMEVLFAPDAGQNALLVPQSILYKLFGEFLVEIIKLF